MNSTRNRAIASLVAAAAVVGGLTSGAAAQSQPYQDLRSPDARDTSRAATGTSYTPAASGARDYQDLRSPDARDTSRAATSTSYTPTPNGESSGTDWGDVGIVAGLAVMLIGLGALALFGRRRGSVRKSRIQAVGR